ncbi:hypothetical protein HGA88_06305 [Candidatus Roizmanbacteria bacterium]|nr:hypothetical protein [Candidatus Roizmanbacteria bacterium]
MTDVIEYFSALLATFNWVDGVFFVMVLYFIVTNKGFINTFCEIVGFLGSLIGAYFTYPFFGKLLSNVGVTLPFGILYALAFMISWIVFELIFFAVLEFLMTKIPASFEKNPINKWAGYGAGFVQACVLFFIGISVVFAFPVRGAIKAEIVNSRFGPPFIAVSHVLEQQIKGVFGEAVSESLNFLTVKPTSTESIDLGFKVPARTISPDSESEDTMFELVNQERRKQGISTLKFDSQLRDVAREYAQQMLENGFFSHTSLVDKTTVADRVEKKGINYTVVGENLAFAGDVYQAHEGLMNSEGHRRNILTKEYGNVGIGVMDGGIYGKMFVQVFKD